MGVEPPAIPFLSNIGLMLTFKCTVACPHCIVEAGPRRTEEMNLEHALAWIKQASLYRDGHIRGLALTGGEPFYNIDNLSQVAETGGALGFVVSVVTNAFWAATAESALQTLAKIPAIRMICLSTDVYHQKAIPFANIRNAVEAARTLGLVYSVAVCTDNEADQDYKRILDDLAAIGAADNVRASIAFPVGRAQKTARHFTYHMTSEPTEAACFTASSPIIFPDGKVMACIGPLLTLPPGHPLYLGNLYQEALPDILNRAEVNPILHLIRVWGPHKLVSLLREYGFEDLLPTSYISRCICDVCYKLLSDERIVSALTGILQNKEIQQTVAYARVYYLNETTMAEMYHLNALNET